MADAGFFSDSEESGEPESQVHVHFGQAVLVSPPAHNADPPSDAEDEDDAGPVQRLDWNIGARPFMEAQARRQICSAHLLLTRTQLSPNLIYSILRLAPVEYTGLQMIPDAQSSVFKVHFYQDKMGLILLTSGQLYALDLKTGQFWHDDAGYSLTKYLNRVRAAAFHPTQPLLLLHHQSWAPGCSLNIIRYPTSLEDPDVPQRKKIDVGAVSPRGLSCAGQSVLTFHAGTHSLALHDFDRLLEDGFTGSRLLSHLTQGHAVYFAKLLDQAAGRHLVSWQTQVGDQKPLRAETLTRTTQTTTHFYGPTSKICDAQYVAPHVVAATEKHAVYIWRTDGVLRATLRQHHNLIQSIALTRSVLLTASFDKTVRVWDLATLRQRNQGNAAKYVYTGPKRKPQAIDCSQGRVLIGFDDKSVDVYRI